MRASHALVGVAARSLVSAGDSLTLPQFRALVVVDQLGAPRLTDVATALGVGLPSVSRLCDRLASTGLLTRSVNPDSRREVLVALTPRARRLVHRVLRRRRDLLAGVVGRLDAGQRSALLAALTALDAAAGTAEALPVTGPSPARRHVGRLPQRDREQPTDSDQRGSGRELRPAAGRGEPQQPGGEQQVEQHADGT